MSNFGSAWPIIRGAAPAFKPPRLVPVSQGVAESLVIRQPGGYSGNWSAEETPYMVAPMNDLASRRHESVCFVGPARTGKTLGLVDGWLARNVTCDPGDMLIVQMSQEKAREYSKTRVDRIIQHSPAVNALMSKRGHDDNTHDKLFVHGMWVKIGWPSATQLSSSDYRYVVLTDYDRMPDNIDGEGSGYGLAVKRTQTFLSRGMCMVESSPGRDYSDPHWLPKTPHEAPPATGVVGIYNNSDRHRWYWACPDCHGYFEAAPGLRLFSTLPKESDLLEEVRTANLRSLADRHANVVCPHCSSILPQKLKPLLNNLKTARWVADGQMVERGGVVTGERPPSAIAGYWLGGVAAAYQKWDSLLLRYLQGLRELAMTGSDHTLKTTINTDQGMPYLPRHLLADKEASIKDRLEDSTRFVVPDGARFLVATVDVQGGTNGRFVVEVRAFGEHLESWLVDRYSISTTERNGVAAQVDPSGYQEDWDLLTQKVVQATYKTNFGQEMRLMRVAVDIGGEQGTTAAAYAWYRRLRRLALSARVRLVKGAGGKGNQGKPVVLGHARDKDGRPMRDMPITLIDTDYFKDLIDGALRRRVPGPMYYHAPSWLPESYFDELRAEVKNKKGKWTKVRARNEALDLWVYALAMAEELGFGPQGRLNWESPPPWAMPLPDNSELLMPEQRRAEQAATKAESKPATQRPADDGGWTFDRRN